MADLTNVGVAQGTQILRFPSTVADQPVDANGQKNQFMLIQISTSTKGSLMGSDAIIPPGPPTTEDGRQTFSDSLPNKPYNMFGGVAEVNKVIALPMPANYEVVTKIDYTSEFEASNAMKMADFAMGNSSVTSKLGGFALAATLNGAANAKPGGLINSLTNQLTQGGTLDKDPRAQIEASQRIAQNPMKEVMFTGLGFRDYSFSYILSPKNSDEADQIKKIIATLRYYALPELALGRLYFIFPGVFRFRFMIGSKENPWIPAIGTSVIETISVDYSPNGNTWSSFSTGQPTFIRLSIRIKEIELVDRTRVDLSSAKGGF